MSKIPPIPPIETRFEPLPAGMSSNDPVALIATWFGAGRMRPAPGTFGTLAAVPFAFLIMLVYGPAGMLLTALILIGIGTWAADKYGKKSGVPDDQSIVIDEVVGLFIAAIPADKSLALWITAVALFRLFDVWKPWPASFFDDNSNGGFYVVMDDVVAGIYAMFGVSIVATLINYG